MAWASLEQIAQVLNLTPRYVNKLVKEQGMPRQGRGEYDLVMCVHWYIDFLKAQIVRSRSGDESESDARRRLLSANADIREAERARMHGELIPVKSAVEVIERGVHSFKTRMLALPTKAAGRVLGRTSLGEIKGILEDDVYQALRELENAKIEIRGIAETGQYLEERLETTPETLSKPVGGQGKKAQRGGKRRAGPVGNGQG
jgi:hypothetical protein